MSRLEELARDYRHSWQEMVALVGSDVPVVQKVADLPALQSKHYAAERALLDFAKQETP